MPLPQEGHEVLDCVGFGIQRSEGGVSFSNSCVLGIKEPWWFGALLDVVPALCNVVVDVLEVPRTLDVGVKDLSVSVDEIEKSDVPSSEFSLITS